MDSDFDAEGWWSQASHRFSPHHDPRPPQQLVDTVVLHAISLPPDQFGGEGIEQLFMGQLPLEDHPYYRSLAGIRVSAHFVIDRPGRCVQYVSVHQRAWHAGVSRFLGRERCNDFSVGIELEGSDTQAFTEEQYQRLNQLLAALVQALPQLRYLTGHQDIAPERKTDPGPCFEWRKVADSGLQLWRLKEGGG